MRKLSLVLLLLAALVMGVAAQDAVELRITWYDDGNEGEVLRDLLDRFEAENPDITVVIDTVAYNVILEQLPSQVQAGQAPDMARVTQFASLRDYYLDLTPYLSDAEAFASYFPAPLLAAFRPDGDETGLYGFPTQLTVTGPYINRTLFEQAGVEVPSDTSDAVTWAEWTEATKAVAEATGTLVEIAIDRSGHRIAGPMISNGATILDAEGNVTIDSEGFRAFAEQLKAWHDEDLTAPDIWLGSGGSYAAAAPYFISGDAVMYMAGSWQIGNFDANIGDAFDWEAVPNPAGPGGSTGMPGGATLMAFANTEHPAEVARVMEYLVSPEVYAEFTARTLFIPGHLALPEYEYVTESESAAAALSVFAAEVPKLADQAWGLQLYAHFTPLANSMRDRLTQYMIGELSLDDAISRIQQDIDEAIAAASS